MLRKALAAACLLLALGTSGAAQTPAGGEFQVNSYTTGIQMLASAGMGPSGDFVILWVSYPPIGAFGQLFSASGSRRGGEFRVSAATTGTEGNPNVAVGSRGDFVVVWRGSSSPGNDIRGRRFDAAGTALGSEFLVNHSTSFSQSAPNVARAADGRFTVIWSYPTFDGNDDGVAARRFDASGNALGGAFVVNTYTTGAQYEADVAVDPNGNFVAVWQDSAPNRDGSASAIFGQRFDAEGNRLGAEFQVNSYTTGAQRHPSVSTAPAGDFVVVWSTYIGSGASVFSRRFDAAGNALGNDFVVPTSPTPDQYACCFNGVAHDAAGNFVVTWFGWGDGSGQTVSAQRFTASGARRGAEFRVNTYTTSNQMFPAVASDSVGNLVVAWHDDPDHDGDSIGVFAQRYGGIGPAVLTVDTTSNQVLEPGEMVDVRPSWRNSNGAAQTFSATLTNITGPTGATYAITDGLGDYGTVADGTTAPCADCYAVSVSNPAIRPAVHWDASAVESILPDTLGQQKHWLLHIGRSFTDVPATNGFYRFIETLLHHGVTAGCSTTQYCPASSTTREQMAVFVLVAKEGTGYVPAACTTPVFTDVPASSPFCRWIEELVRRGVAGGCGPGVYCPASAVTREQMSVFVLRTLDPALSPPACTTPLYNDVPETSGFCRWIEELTRRAVVSGCGGGSYCPTASVTREQMGVFISATFGLTLYGP